MVLLEKILRRVIRAKWSISQSWWLYFSFTHDLPAPCRSTYTLCEIAKLIFLSVLPGVLSSSQSEKSTPNMEIRTYREQCMSWIDAKAISLSRSDLVSRDVSDSCVNTIWLVSRVITAWAGADVAAVTTPWGGECFLVKQYPYGLFKGESLPIRFISLKWALCPNRGLELLQVPERLRLQMSTSSLRLLMRFWAMSTPCFCWAW